MSFTSQLFAWLSWNLANSLWNFQYWTQLKIRLLHLNGKKFCFIEEELKGERQQEKLLKWLDGGKSAILHKGLKWYHGHITVFLTLKYLLLSFKFTLIPHILNLVWNYEHFKCFISYEKPNVWAEKEVLHLATKAAFYLFFHLKREFILKLKTGPNFFFERRTNITSFLAISKNCTFPQTSSLFCSVNIKGKSQAIKKPVSFPTDFAPSNLIWTVTHLSKNCQINQVQSVRPSPIFKI